MGLLTRFFGKKATAEEMKAPTATPVPVAPITRQPTAPSAPIASGIACPWCLAEVTRTEGSPVSPYLGQYRCTKCSWRALTCGSTGCDGYLLPEEMGYADTVRYNCVKCGWSGTGTRY